MSSIPDKTDFEPSPETKYRWLSTRKAPYFAGNLKLEGLFHTHHYNVDVTWVVSAIALELVAAGLIVGGALQKSNEKLIIAFGLTFLFMALDFFGMLLHHDPVAKRLRFRNLATLSSDQGSRIGYLNDAKRFSSRRFAGTLMIVISALIKIGATLGYIALANLLVGILLLIAYFLIMYVHLNHTGYAYSEFIFRKKVAKEHKEWAQSKLELSGIPGEGVGGLHSAQKRPHKFSTSFPLEKIDERNSLNINGHEVHLVTKKENFYEYRLIANGLLTDEDVTHLGMGQSAVQRAELAKACLDMQLNSQLNN